MPDYVEKPLPILLSTADCTKVAFTQLNNQKVPLSMSVVKRSCDSSKLFLHLGTEPHCFNNKPTGLDNRHHLFYNDVINELPHAFIYASAQLRLYKLEQFCGRDIICAKLETGSPELGDAIVCAMYWCRKQKKPPTKWLKAADYARKNGLILITCSDTNSHSVLFNCPESDARGKLLENYLIHGDMEVVNVGNKYTYDGSNKGHAVKSITKDACKTIIDATMVSTRYSDQIKNWCVSSTETYSDHRLISFSIDIPSPKYTFVLDTRERAIYY